jgi:hypothetical protein
MSPHENCGFSISSKWADPGDPRTDNGAGPLAISLSESSFRVSHWIRALRTNSFGVGAPVVPTPHGQHTSPCFSASQLC